MPSRNVFSKRTCLDIHPFWTDRLSTSLNTKWWAYGESLSSWRFSSSFQQIIRQTLCFQIMPFSSRFRFRTNWFCLTCSPFGYFTKLQQPIYCSSFTSSSMALLYTWLLFPWSAFLTLGSSAINVLGIAVFLNHCDSFLILVDFCNCLSAFSTQGLPCCVLRQPCYHWRRSFPCFP